MDKIKYTAAYLALGVLGFIFLTTMFMAAASEGFWPTLGWASGSFVSYLAIKGYWRHWAD